MRRPGSIRAAALGCLMFGPSATALAQTAPATPDQQVDALFREAAEQMRKGHCLQPKLAERSSCLSARDKFKRVYAQSPLALGALRNRAFIEKSLGLVASATASFQELARVAPGHPDPSRREWGKFSSSEAAALDLRVPVLVIEILGAESSAASLKLDGRSLPLLRQQTLRLDPGSHELVLRVGAQQPRVTRLDLAERERARVVLDPRAGDAQAFRAVDVPSQPDQGRAAARSWALGLGLGGGALVLAGLGFGTDAWLQKRKACAGGALCDPAGYNSATRSARYANVLVGTGLVIAAGGLTLHLLTPRITSSSVAVQTAGAF